MKNVFIEAMNEPFDLSALLAKIDYHHIRGNLTDEEREELVALARHKATPMGGVDVMAMLHDHEARLKALEASGTPSGGDESVEDYQVGKWYRNGDKVRFNGKVYTCIAPEGVVCTWSPAEYPAYWE